MATQETQKSLEVEFNRLQRQLKQMEAEKQRAEQKLSALDAEITKYEAIAKNAEGALWVIIEGKIAFANPGTQVLLDRSEAELQSLPVSELVYPEDADLLEKQLSSQPKGTKVQQQSPCACMTGGDRSAGLRFAAPTSSGMGCPLAWGSYWIPLVLSAKKMRFASASSFILH